MTIRTCTTCKHCAPAGATYGCELTAVTCPVTGGKLVSSCWGLRRDPMGMCGPKGKLWEERQPAEVKPGPGEIIEMPAGVMLQ